MTVSEVLKASTLARIDAELLMAHILSISRTGVLLAADTHLTQDHIQRWNQLEARRATGEPIAYITGTKEFYGRAFTVSPATLIPRPSTEELVTASLALIREKRESTLEVDTGISVLTRILRPSETWMTADLIDMGCGSGCIGISLGLELKMNDRTMTMIDLSSQAIDIARGNAITLGLQTKTRWVVGDGSTAIASLITPSIIISNPPYIPNTERLMRDVAAFEPHLALFAGPQGLDVIRPMLLAMRNNPLCLAVALECRTDQIEEVEQLLSGNFSYEI